MDIIVAGCGKVGKTLVQRRAKEGHNLTVIDSNRSVVDAISVEFDVMAVSGNCASKETLLSAGIMEAELVIAATGADEVNLLCCMTAHGLNEKVHTIARIRNPEYGDQIMTMPQVFPLSMTVNPERHAAREIERLLKYPGFLRRDTFAKGLVEIVELRVDEQSKLRDLPLSQLGDTVKCKVLVCAVLRNGTAIAPRGDFVLRSGDRIFVTAPTAHLTVLLKNLGIITRKVRKVLICGGSKITYYLASLLEKDGIAVQIVERNYQKCLELAELLPDASVIHGDCSNQAVLEDQGLHQCDALVSLTGVDETNMIVSLYANKSGVSQIITKLGRSENNTIANYLELGSVLCPRDLCSNDIVRYVRAMENQTGAAVSVHMIADGQVEAVEFMVDEATRNCDVPLKEIKLKPNVLIANITHGTRTHIPNGDSRFQVGDRVVVVTSGRGLNQINDIFA